MLISIAQRMHGEALNLVADTLYAMSFYAFDQSFDK